MKILFCLLLLIEPACAELISSHNEEQAAIRAGKNHLMKNGCEDVDWSRTKNIKLNTTDDPMQVTLTGNNITIVCLKMVSGSTVTVTWSPPTTRENETGLPPGEIAGYEVYYFQDGGDDHIAIIEPGTTSFTTEPLASGIWFFAMVTVDTDGLKSELSDTVTTEI